MNLVELFAPKDSLNEAQRQLLGELLVTEMISVEGAPAEMVERARHMTWLLIHQPETWTVGGRRVTATDSPRFLVRVTMPGGDLDDAMRGELISRATRVISEVVGDPDRFYKEPLVWVQISEVPDGNLGVFGHVVRTKDILELVLHGKIPEQGAGIARSACSAVDPICGMTIPLTSEAIVVEQDGSEVAFCSTACRDMFQAKRA